MAAASFLASRNANGVPVLTVIDGDNPTQNTTFQSIANSFNSATPGTYKQLVESIARNFNPSLIPTAELNKATDFYVSKNVTTPWNPATQGAQPPAGTFDPVYYQQQNPDLITRWNDANTSVVFGQTKLPDVDITKRYDLNTFLHQHYTTTGKLTGLRGNQAEDAAAVKTYEERRAGITDKEKQTLRDTVLGVGTTGQKLPLDATLEQLVNQENQQKFNYLVQDVLSKTVAEITKARQQESKYDFLRGLPGFDEVLNFSSNLSNDILGDSGIGGYLTLAGQGEAAKKLEKGIQSLTGVNNNVSYNWQKWFDEQLATRYENLKEITDPADAKKVYQLNADFAKKFVDEYLKPRFDSSKSMAEFVSYMDVREDEQNILQTQTVSNKLKELGVQKVESFLGELARGSTGYFDSAFYFDPQGVEAKQNLYATQKTDVAAAWEQAKQNPSALVNGMSWSQWAYKYGLDPRNKDQFAKLHYEVVGKGKGYDPSSDKPTVADLYNYMDKELSPYLAEAKEAFGDDVFLQFMTPDQLADELVRNIDPLKTPEQWEETLKRYNIEGTNKTVAEVKDLILEATRTAPAADIRESIKSLNEKRVTPTQKLLGIEYIQRPTDDVKKEASSGTALYDLFKRSGYGGTEDEFYKEFMPDVDRTDQQLISNALKKDNKSFGFNIDTSDPFSALGSIESFFSGSAEGSKTPEKFDYFSLFGEAEKKAESQKTSSFSFFDF